ncbi:MAG TPA: NifU family protein [Thermoanaerobaculia bacterium]|nr:NifU family protein [Thermoanaerobaculia bacterium]
MRDFEKRSAEIEQLTRALEGVADQHARAAAEALMRAVMDLHGDALARVVAIAGRHGAVDALLRDELLSSLLLLYDLHPAPVEERVRGALAKVRPYVASHGGGVELVAINDGVVRLRMEGSCEGCPSSARTVKLAIEEAVLEAAPEITAVVVDDTSRPEDGRHARWQELPAMQPLSDGDARTLDLDGTALLLCRIGDALYAYGTACPGCGAALRSSAVQTGAVTCTSCGRRYDVQRAGRALDESSNFHLEPFPLLVENGRARVALPV